MTFAAGSGRKEYGAGWRPVLTGAADPLRMVGQHPRMRDVRDLVRRSAPTDATVLVTGESGTGKEIVARAVHAQSARAGGPFVSVNCAAIPAELMESEVFGHERGAFTGATTARAGLLQVANTGTIFFDEIAEMSPAMQVKLLRVLQDHEVRPLGSDRTVRVDVRVIAATNKDLAREVAQRRFREDLFYRLQIVPIEMPPLRDRRSDIPLLVQHFLEKLSVRYPGRQITIGADAMRQLVEYEWPGNVRELENVVERIVLLAERPVVCGDDVPAELRTLLATRRVPEPVIPSGGCDLNSAVASFESRLIDEALRRTKGNKQAAARMLGLGRTTLLAKLKRLRSPVREQAGVHGEFLAP